MTLSPKDFVTGKLLTDIYPRKHKLFFVFTNDSTPKKAPVPHREWMQAIDDSLSGQVDEAEYTNPSIQALFEAIEKDKITPEERARMKDEHNQEEAETRRFKEGEEKGVKETARNLKALGVLTEEEIASVTGLSLKVVKAL